MSFSKIKAADDPRVVIHPGAIVCKEAELSGDVTIGSRTVIHTKARVIAKDGPIVIGENNIIEERVVIINECDKKSGDSSGPTMTIGDFNFFEVGSHIECLKIGDQNVFETKSAVARNTVITNGCVVGAKCSLKCQEVIPENTVIYGSNCDRRVMAERPLSQAMQIEFLSKVLPNYHHLKRPTKGNKEVKSEKVEKTEKKAG